MDQEKCDMQISLVQSHPWVTLAEAGEAAQDGDSVGEAIRCTLDEIRYA